MFLIRRQKKKHEDFFTSSAWIYNNQHITTIDHSLIKEWYSYLCHSPDKIYRHELFLDGYERILRSGMLDVFSQSEELSVGIITVLAGLEGLICEDSKDPSKLFVNLGSYLYNRNNDIPRKIKITHPIPAAHAKKFFAVLYRLRSKIAHAKADLVTTAYGSKTYKDLLKALRIGSPFSGRTLGFSFGIAMPHLFAVCEAKRQVTEEDLRSEKERILQKD